MAKGITISGYNGIGENVSYKVEAGILYLAVSLTSGGAPSASGKSLVVASTRGNAAIEGGLKIGLNVYKPNK